MQAAPLDSLASTLAARHGLGIVVLFGSRGRGTEHARSDTDLAVLRGDGRRLSFHELAMLQSEFASSLGADVEVDVADLATPDALFRYEVVSAGRVLVEAEPGLWSAFVARTLIDHDDIAPFVEACVAGVHRAARAARGT